MNQMKILMALSLVFLPIHAHAAEWVPQFHADQNLLVASSAPGNLYAVGGSVAVTTPTSGDLVIIGGSITDESTVVGDALFIGGSVSVRSAIGGDARIVGGRVVISESVGGDLVAVAGSFTDTSGSAKEVFVIAAKVALAGASGPVKIYGNTIELSGTFADDVTIVSAGRITLSASTTIKGALHYQAPEQANIPSSAIIKGGVHYTGASYLPTSEEARAIAFASFGVFLFVKILGALILAGLFAGLFPVFARHVVRRAVQVSARRKLLTLLLGFGVIVAAPVFVLFLSITFVGLGLALILTLVYLLLIPIAFIYAATVLGSYIAQYLFKRTELRWSDAVFGMFVLFLVWSLPVVGGLLIGIAVLYMAGVVTTLVYRFAFPRDPLNELEG